MARLPIEAALGAASRVLQCFSHPEALKRIQSCHTGRISCSNYIVWPLASPLLGNAAVAWAGTSWHAYHHVHGNGNSNSTDDEAADGDHIPDLPGFRSGLRSWQGRVREGLSRSGATRHHRRQQRVLQQDLQGCVERSSDKYEAQQLPEHVARMALQDPLVVLMTSMGFPLALSLKLKGPRDKMHELAEQQSIQRFVMSEFDLDSEDSSSSTSQQPAAESDESSSTTTGSVVDCAAESTSQRGTGTSQEGACSLLSQQQQHEASSSSAAGEPGVSAGRVQAPGLPGVAASVHQHLQSVRAAIKASADQWGTTQQSPAEIAQQIADSNRASGAGGGGGGGDGAGDDGEDDDDAPLALNPGEERYADASQVASGLKEMDEIFQTLAKVPWLDDGDVDDRELRELVAVELLGALEKVGWSIRDKVQAVWAGERDEAVLTAGLGPREAAAISSILYHTQQLVEQYGQPPQSCVDAALKAASAGSSSGGG